MASFFRVASHLEITSDCISALHLRLFPSILNCWLIDIQQILRILSVHCETASSGNKGKNTWGHGGWRGGWTLQPVQSLYHLLEGSLAGCSTAGTLIAELQRNLSVLTNDNAARINCWRTRRRTCHLRTSVLIPTLRGIHPPYQLHHWLSGLRCG